MQLELVGIVLGRRGLVAGQGQGRLPGQAARGHRLGDARAGDGVGESGGVPGQEQAARKGRPPGPAHRDRPPAHGQHARLDEALGHQAPAQRLQPAPGPGPAQAAHPQVGGASLGKEPGIAALVGRVQEDQGAGKLPGQGHLHLHPGQEFLAGQAEGAGRGRGGPVGRHQAAAGHLAPLAALKEHQAVALLPGKGRPGGQHRPGPGRLQGQVVVEHLPVQYPARGG